MGIQLKILGFIIFLGSAFGTAGSICMHSPAVTGKCSVLKLEHQTCQVNEGKQDPAPDLLD